MRLCRVQRYKNFSQATYEQKQAWGKWRKTPKCMKMKAQRSGRKVAVKSLD
jgi:hypothetical protein